MGRDSDLGSGRMVSIATGDGGIVEAQYIDKLWVDLIRPNYARFLGRTDIAKTFFSLGTKSAHGFCNLLTSQWILQFVN